LDLLYGDAQGFAIQALGGVGMPLPQPPNLTKPDIAAAIAGKGQSLPN
jgi:hypothetical protein